MRYNPISRRHFLQGMGASLLLPLMPSLLPRAYAQAAGATPPRFIQFVSSFGQYGQHFFPSDTGLVQMGGVFARPLNGITGDVSKIIGPGFSNYKNKISLLRGMHVLAASNLHNGSLPSCSSSTPEDNEGNGRPFFGYSMDSVISESAKIYPDPTGKQRHVNFCPAASSYRNYSWTKRAGAVEHLSNTTTTAALLSKFASFTDASDAAAINARSTSVIGKVYDDYKGLRDGGKLSLEDKTRLEAYMSLIDQVQKGQAAVIRSCAPPGQEADVNETAMHHNQAAILAAAIACGQTRVASYVLSTPYDPIHGYSHDSSQSVAHANYQLTMGSYIAYLMKLLDAIPDAGGGSALDNSVLYWGNEFGENANGDPHRPDNMTALVAGGAGGKLQMGYYMDYRKTNGVPFNNFLISIANSMGLSSADYERDGVVGFGEYNDAAIARYAFQNATSTAERRKALPLFYKGPVMG